MKSGVVYISSLDGSEVEESRLVKTCRLWLDTGFIKAWYKNGDGYFVKFRDCDIFEKVILR